MNRLHVTKSRNFAITLSFLLHDGRP